MMCGKGGTVCARQGAVLWRRFVLFRVKGLCLDPSMAALFRIMHQKTWQRHRVFLDGDVCKVIDFGHLCSALPLCVGGVQHCNCHGCHSGSGPNDWGLLVILC